MRTNGQIIYQCIIGATANEALRPHDLLLVFPIHTRHFFPVLSFRNAMPTINGEQLCDKCFLMHQIDDTCAGTILQCCMLCNNRRCANRNNNNELLAVARICNKCERAYWKDACYDAHLRDCTYVLCNYCNTYYDSMPRSRCVHYVLHCNVMKCKACGERYRYVHAITQ